MTDNGLFNSVTAIKDGVFLVISPGALSTANERERGGKRGKSDI